MFVDHSRANEQINEYRSIISPSNLHLLLCILIRYRELYDRWEIPIAEILFCSSLSQCAYHNLFSSISERCICIMHVLRKLASCLSLTTGDNDEFVNCEENPSSTSQTLSLLKNFPIQTIKMNPTLKGEIINQTI